MTFNGNEVVMGLVLASLPALIGIYAAFVLERHKLALLLLLVSASLLRLLMITVDPYLHEWDERFHALVAKNMTVHPFKPMLRADPIMDYDYKAWCCSHIWVHKQPLFLWQMAASMKLLGVNEVTMRVPSMIMGVAGVFFMYEIARHWTKSHTISMLTGLLGTFSYYQLELTSGRFSLDHNDLSMTFYVTASIWAFVRYVSGSRHVGWALLVGLFVGCAVLNKWLTGLLVFGGWGLYILMSKELRGSLRSYSDIALSVVVALAVFLPWQLYIIHAFPAEAAWSYEFNRKHITEALEGHYGTVWYYINFAKTSYGKYLLPFFLIGTVRLFRSRKRDRVLSSSMFSMAIVVYLFFSLVVRTKMPSLVYPVVVIVLVTIAVGIEAVVRFGVGQGRRLPFVISAAGLLAAAYSLKPWQIALYRGKTNETRNAMISNTEVYKSLKDVHLDNRIILNCKSFEDTDVMFYTDHRAYQWFPIETVFDSLQQAGHRFAAFKSHTNQYLPEYISRDTAVLILDHTIK